MTDDAIFNEVLELGNTHLARVGAIIKGGDILCGYTHLFLVTQKREMKVAASDNNFGLRGGFQREMSNPGLSFI